MSGGIGGEGITSGLPKYNPTNNNETPSDILKGSTPSIHDEFKPQKKDDNMMAENDPVKRQPDNWQAEAKKGPA